MGTAKFHELKGTGVAHPWSELAQNSGSCFAHAWSEFALNSGLH
ncbi:21835_t:CDS:2, partial [Racocetra persica]